MKWWRGWAPLVVLPGVVLVMALPAWPGWATMWMLALAIYAGCKWLTWRRTPVEQVPIWKHAAYLFAWPGLDARAFLSGSAARGPTRAEWFRAVRNFVIGVVLLFGVAPVMWFVTHYGAGWVGMAGLVFLLHFGSFQLLSCFWRAVGVDAKPLMNMPLRSVSLGEFWGRRWNTAFRDLTHRFLYRPFVRSVGPKAAIAGGFIFSGLVHDLVISVPAGGGYGGPTLFFAAHGAGILLERSALGERIGLARGVRGRIFVLLLALGLAPVLFHAPFVDRIVIPFMKALGAI